MPRKVLVVDDGGDIREVLAEQLATHGFEVLMAGNGLAALLHVKRQRPEVVVLDVMMPRLGGLEALKRIRAFHPEAKVVVVSGSLDDEVRRQALALGAAGVLEKPVSLTDILAALGETERPPPTPTEPRGEGAGARGRLQPPPANPGRSLLVDSDPMISASTCNPLPPMDNGAAA